MNCRHFGITIILLTQFFIYMKPECKTQIDNVFLFKYEDVIQKKTF